MRTVADQLGIMAYLWIMYGGPPDRAMVSAALHTDTSTLKWLPSLAALASQPLVDQAADADVQSEQAAA